MLQTLPAEPLVDADHELEVSIVYSAIDQRQPFSSGEVVDHIVGIRLPLHDIFA